MSLAIHKAELTAPDASRVVTQFFSHVSLEKTQRIMSDVARMSADQVERELEGLRQEFQPRHRKNMDAIFNEHFQRIEHSIPPGITLTDAQKTLVGAYFTNEFSIEAAAIFNPSMVPHPNQDGVPEGSLRFIMSLRATGEGHKSSIVFRTGIADKDGNVTYEPKTQHAEVAEVSDGTTYNREAFKKKLVFFGVKEDVATALLEGLGDAFRYEEFIASVSRRERQFYFSSRQDELKKIRAHGALDYLQPNYEVTFPKDVSLSSCVLFPQGDFESKGLEDARFVRFHEEDGRTVYYGTYTAYNGSAITPQLISTEDFSHFKISAFTGAAAEGKGMALFPRKIHGKYMMLGRQDGENITIMSSDDVHRWEHAELLHAPKHGWDLRQLGNCGSPIETDKGWLVITHGVGAMRKYAIGAILLDLDDPTKVIGEIKEPILTAVGAEREGYVPNVVYSCGPMKHGDHLVLPYAASDHSYSLATFSIQELLSLMEKPVEVSAPVTRKASSRGV